MNKFDDKDVRGRILNTLNNQYPRAISFKMLSYALTAARYDCSKVQLNAHLVYLQEKGYIKLEKVGHEEFDLSRNMVSLTAKGKDLVEGSIGPDPGVMLL